MSSVVSLHGQSIESDRRKQFIDAMATAFDGYVEKVGYEPEAVAWGFAGVRQPARTHWLVTGDSEGSASAVVCFVASGLIKDALEQ